MSTAADVQHEQKQSWFSISLLICWLIIPINFGIFWIPFSGSGAEA